MGTTDSVATHFFQNLQLALDGARIHRSSQATQVMMHADTVYLHLFTIQDKSFLCIEAESTDAGRSIITVEYLAGLFIQKAGANTQRCGIGNIPFLTLFNRVFGRFIQMVIDEIQDQVTGVVGNGGYILEHLFEALIQKPLV